MLLTAPIHILEVAYDIEEVSGYNWVTIVSAEVYPMKLLNESDREDIFDIIQGHVRVLNIRRFFSILKTSTHWTRSVAAVGDFQVDCPD